MRFTKSAINIRKLFSASELKVSDLLGHFFVRAIFGSLWALPVPFLGSLPLDIPLKLNRAGLHVIGGWVY